jgi:hypothetical protein
LYENNLESNSDLSITDVQDDDEKQIEKEIEEFEDKKEETKQPHPQKQTKSDKSNIGTYEFH